MKPLKLTFTFKKDGSTLARLLVVGTIILSGIFVVLAFLFIRKTLNDAFAIPSPTVATLAKDDVLLSPDLIESVRAAQEARLTPAAEIPRDLYDPFAPIIIPPSPPPAPAPDSTP